MSDQRLHRLEIHVDKDMKVEIEADDVVLVLKL